MKSKSLCSSLITVVLLLFFSSGLSFLKASDWYVDDGGTDSIGLSGSGNQDTPWRSIFYAVVDGVRRGSVYANDNIHILSGTYHETDIIYIDTRLNIYGADITTVKVDIGVDTDVVFLFDDDSDSTILSDITIGRTDSSDTTLADSALIWVDDGSNNITIQNCVLDARGDTTALAVFLEEVDELTFSGNTLYLDSGDTGLDFNPIGNPCFPSIAADTYLSDTIIIQKNTFEVASDTSVVALFGALDYAEIKNNKINRGSVHLYVKNLSSGENYLWFLGNEMGEDSASDATVTALLIQEDPLVDDDDGDVDSALKKLTIAGNTFVKYDTAIAFHPNLENDDVNDTFVLINLNSFQSSPTATDTCDTAISDQILNDTYMWAINNYYGVSDTPCGYGTDLHTGAVLQTGDTGACLLSLDSNNDDTGLHFDPWSGAKIGRYAQRIIKDDTTNYVPEDFSDISLNIDVQGGSVTVAVAEYNRAPRSGFVTSWEDAFKDIFIPPNEIANLNRLEITFEVTPGIDSDSDTPVWYYDDTNEEWVGCDSSYSSAGDIILCIGQDATGTNTKPALQDLVGLVFGCKGTPSTAPSKKEGVYTTEHLADDGFSDCFIATACYGSPLAREVEVLCEFRNQYLLTNKFSRGLVKIYYTLSPSLAEFISSHSALRRAVRVQIKPLVWLAERLVSHRDRSIIAP